MNGLEYMNKICPTTSRGKDPNREDVADAFDDGVAEAYKQVEEGLWIKGIDYIRKDALLDWAKRQMSFEQGYESGEAESAYKDALEDLINYLNKMENNYDRTSKKSFRQGSKTTCMEPRADNP